MMQRTSPARPWLRGVALAAALTAGAAAQLPAQVKALGIDTAGMDRSVRPQDDFYQFVNGGWQRNTQIPADRSVTGSFVALADRSEAAIHQILDEAVATRNAAPGSDTQKLGDLYASYMDSARIEAAGYTPVKPDLDRIAAVSGRGQYPALFANAARQGVGSPFAVFVRQDGKASDRYTVYVSQSGLGLPDRDYYLSQDAKLVAARTAYVGYLTRLFTLASQPDPAGSAQRVLALETQLAQKQWDRVRSRNRDLTYNKMSVADLQKLTPGYNWEQYLQAAGIRTDEVIVSQPTYLPGADSVLAAAPVADVKAYMAARVLNNAAPFLSSAFANANFDFRGRALQGLAAQRDRWKRGASLVEDGLGQMLGKAYVQRNFPAQSKAAMQRLVSNLLTAFGQGIDELQWMSAETKAQAHDKLSHITVKIGYPDVWQDYSALRITRGDLFANLRAISDYQYNRMVSRLGKPVDRTEWGMTPQTVNAYYNPSNNEIVFPAAILQPPFFNAEADDAVNYGGIVAVIGHEVSHAFDDQGSKSDGAGNLRNWWTEADQAAFRQRTEALGAQYSAYEPLQGLHVNGNLTMGENIGDLSGLAVAYRAYRTSLNGHEAPVIAGFTGDQRFFMGWAQVWRTMFRDEALRQRLLTDPHSPGYFRANGPLVNNEAFYRAFGVKEGDKMYRPETQRVVIW
ncbi:MAG TPA: M13-type metalloendopeptidase [Longimicrobium sp.]|nr:M13-type metalloendopeptidase [Longimicrobium sp.]